MHRTTFIISKMDCPSEERVIRMKLEDLPQVQSLSFDIPERKLQVVHSGPAEEILQNLNSLNFGTSFLESIPVTTPAGKQEEAAGERRLLWVVLAINAFFFVVEMISGVLSRSMGLVADSLDMLADSLVYGLALLAVGGAILRKKRIARMAGYLQLLLAGLGLAEVLRRWTGMEAPPSFGAMLVISTWALAGNGLCLYLLQKNRSSEVHMRASVIFTSNDVIANLGVIVAGALVYMTGSPIPDLLMGAIVFIMVARGSFAILALSK